MKPLSLRAQSNISTGVVYAQLLPPLIRKSTWISGSTNCILTSMYFSQETQDYGKECQLVLREVSSKRLIVLECSREGGLYKELLKNLGKHIHLGMVVYLKRLTASFVQVNFRAS